MSLKIIIESHIPFVEGVFESLGAEVVYLDPEQFDADTVRDADALMVRTRTRCDSRLLEGSRCRIVATATIGTDHIDTAWCEANGVRVANAPGCNAPAVAQYVAGCISQWAAGRDWNGLTLGVVGVGHVGSIVERWARWLGLKTLLCDPPREARGESGFTSFDTVLREADIITFHTPLTTAPDPWPTFHMFDRAAAEKLRGGQLLINSARGPVTDTRAILDALADGKLDQAAIDCWENEPAIDRDLLAAAAVATPHIAGYSRQGKIRASQIAAEAIADCLGLPRPELDAMKAVRPVPSGITASDADEAAKRIADDTLRLRQNPSDFERLRNTYDLRREPSQP